jgi:hypothetical protein
MLHKETIAVIGATSEKGRLVIEHLLRNPYRLLLMDEESDKLAELKQSLAIWKTEAETDTLLCCREASWEADIIVIAKEHKTIEETAQKIKDVATTKIVIYVAEDNNNQFNLLQQLLPYSKLVQVQLTKNNALIMGKDTVANDTVTRLFKPEGVNIRPAQSIF